jgi:hypothetical protein
MTPDVSIQRLYLMRGMYLLNFVLVGSGVCHEFIQRLAPWEPIVGAAFSFWAALALLSVLGIRYPLAMLPLLFIQLTYKVIWLLGVSLPLSAAGRSSDLTRSFLVAIGLDLLVIPWGYVFARYVRMPSDRWK